MPTSVIGENMPFMPPNNLDATGTISHPGTKGAPSYRSQGSPGTTECGQTYGGLHLYVPNLPKQRKREEKKPLKKRRKEY